MESLPSRIQVPYARHPRVKGLGRSRLQAQQRTLREHHIGAYLIEYGELVYRDERVQAVIASIELH